MFTLRKLIKSDCGAYKDLRLLAFQESSSSFSESFEDEHLQALDFFQAHMGDDVEHFSVGCFMGTSQLVAVATLKRDKRQKARHKSYIHTMYVAPEFRGKGIAEGILNSLIQSARSMFALEQIHLWVLNPETSPAKKLYLKAGFVSQGAVVRNDLKIKGKYVDAEYMTLSIKTI